MSADWKEAGRCEGCNNYDCAHVDLPSVLGDRMRACPWCRSPCVEHGSTYKGRCAECGREATMRQFLVDYPEGTLPIFLERTEG